MTEVETRYAAGPVRFPLRATVSAFFAPSSISTGRAPLSFFTAVGIALAFVALGLAIPIFVTYFEEGIVPRLPTAVLATGLMLAAFLSLVTGLVLDTVTRGRREMKLLAYLAQRGPGEDWDRRQP